MNQATLVFCIHNHQPVGNLPDVFEHAYRHAYLPFLDALEAVPEIKFVLHNSGPLLEWYESNAPDYIERVRGLVERGQLEVLTGGFYEPILSAIPERDARGQIEMLTDYSERNFGMRPRGLWLAERVWEPRLAKTLAESGVEYLPVDDYEFRLAGLPQEELVGSFVTEDQGESVCVLPISKRLRYAIPFQEPEETVKLMKELARKGPGLVAIFGDDGEKFGVWPGTYSHVYAGGWLKRFLGVLRDNRDWLRTATLSEVVDELPRRGRVYLPTSSYPEMMEWALPTPARRQYERFVDKLKQDGDYEEWGPFVSGGIWKNFLSKYEESHLMARKMMRVSNKLSHAQRVAFLLKELEELPDAVKTEVDGRAALSKDVLREARRELWRGQCNCAYWHGVFGGLYLPHLRAAIYEHLIKAEVLLDSARASTWHSVDLVDHDMDGHCDVVLESDSMNLYVAPARGGVIFELDIRRASWNALGTMAPYEEAYHEQFPDDGAPAGDGLRNIHDGLTAKEPGLAKLVRKGATPRMAAVDHFLPRDADLADAESGECELADTTAWRYEYRSASDDDSVGVGMARECVVPVSGVEKRLSIEKRVCLSECGVVKVEYNMVALSEVDIVFASEWNLAFLTGASEWLSVELNGSEPEGKGRRRSYASVEAISLTDRLRSERLEFRLSPKGGAWTWPVETASQSEGGLERVFQALAVVPWWPLRLSSGQRATITLELRSTPVE